MIQNKFKTALLAVMLALCSFSSLRAQKSEMDSLLTVVETTVIDSVKIDALLLISTKLVFNDPDSATHFIDRAFELSSEIEYEKGIAKCYNNYGLASLFVGDNLNALKYFQKSEKSYTALDDKRGMALSMHNIALIYNKLGELEKSIEQYTRAYNLARETKNHRLHGFGLFNIASNHSDLGNYEMAMNFLDSLTTLEKEVGSITPSYDLRAYIFEEQEMPDSAEVYYKRAIAVGLEMQNLHNEASLRLSLANILRNQNKLDEARSQLDTVRQVVKANNFDELESDYYFAMALLESKGRDFKSAYKFNMEYVRLSDSLMKVNNKETINELNARYQTAQKDKELAENRHELTLAEARNTKENSIMMTIAITIVVIVIINILFSIRQRGINSSLKDQNHQKQKQQENIVESIRYAQKIQSSIMPSAKRISEIAPRSFVYFQPKDIVSGDFYWFSKIEGKTVISAVDCTGHGVPGAFMSLIAHNKMRRLLHEKQLSDPGEVLDILNTEIVASLHQESETKNTQDGMDMSICIIDEEDQTINFAGAQNSVMLVRDGVLEEYKPNRFSIGGTMLKQKTFKTHKIHYERGDRLYLYSDGYFDQFGGESNAKLNKGKFKELLIEVSKESPEEARERLHSYFNEWKGVNKQLDDVLVIGTEL
jgi:serine phosphatase RsbU (regulator of sigma subunit)/Tfp pilus assembly protein PilF